MIIRERTLYRWGCRFPALFATAMVALLAGCASAPTPVPKSTHYSDPPYRSDPTLSEADNVVRAAKTAFDAWSRTVRLKILSADGSGVQGKPQVVHLTFGQRVRVVSSDLVSNAAAAASPTPDFGVAGTAIMAVARSAKALLMVAGGGNDAPVATPQMLTHDVSHLVFWMPAEMAKDRKEARHKTDALWGEALPSARSVIHAPYHVTAIGSDVYSNPTYGFTGKKRGMRVEGGGCDKSDIACGYEPGYGGFPQSMPAPDFIDGGKGRVWASAQPLHSSSVDNSRVTDRYYYPAGVDLPDLAVYRAISAQLPSWAYIYLAAGSISLGDGRGLLAEPLVLHQGEILKFSKTKQVR